MNRLQRLIVIGVHGLGLLFVVGCSDEDQEAPAVVEQEESSQISVTANGVTFAITEISPGSFEVGSFNWAGEPIRIEPSTVQTITLLDGFYISSQEVSRELFQAVMEEQPWATKTRIPRNPYQPTFLYWVSPWQQWAPPPEPHTNDSWAEDPLNPSLWVNQCSQDLPSLDIDQLGNDDPATCVSWLDAIHFCNALSRIEGLQPAYIVSSQQVRWSPNANGYRLPTIAEWSFAARNDSKVPTDSLVRVEMGPKGPIDDLDLQPMTEASMASGPNDRGIEGMLSNDHGVQYEWTWNPQISVSGDPGISSQSQLTETNPLGLRDGLYRSAIANDFHPSGDTSWVELPAEIWLPASTASNNIGFRVVRNVESPTKKEPTPVPSAPSMVRVPSGSLDYYGGARDLISVAHEAKIARNLQPPLPEDASVSRDFFISTHEISQALFESVMTLNPPTEKPCPTCPVNQVSWMEALWFCNNLSILEGLEPVYTFQTDRAEANLEASGFRLPTALEWEYAARAGGQHPYPTYQWSQSQSQSQDHELVTDGTGPNPNAWGITNMWYEPGLWEWVWTPVVDVPNYTCEVVDEELPAIEADALLPQADTLEIQSDGVAGDSQEPANDDSHSVPACESQHRVYIVDAPTKPRLARTGVPDPPRSAPEWYWSDNAKLWSIEARSETVGFRVVRNVE